MCLMNSVDERDLSLEGHRVSSANSVDERDLSLEGRRVSNAWESRVHVAGAAAFHLSTLSSFTVVSSGWSLFSLVCQNLMILHHP